MKLIEQNFVAASDPSLVPIPFSSVVESALTDIARGAAVGEGAGAGASVAWSAGVAAIACYGVYDVVAASADGKPRPLAGRHLRYVSAWAFTTTTGFANNDEVTVFRLMYLLGTTETELCSLVWIKTATGYKWKLKQTIGSTTTVTMAGDYSTTPATYKTVCLDIVGVGGTPHLSLSDPDTGIGVLQLALGTSLPAYARVQIGGVAGSVAAPSAASEFRFDSLRVEDDDYGAEHMKRSSGLAIPLLGHRPIDVAKVVLTNGQLAEIGAMASTDVPLLGTAVIPGPQIGIQPGGEYEIACRLAATVPTTPGYTQIIPHEHSLNEVIPDTGITLDMSRVPVWQVKTLRDQNVIMIVNVQGVACHYTVRRLR